MLVPLNVISPPHPTPPQPICSVASRTVCVQVRDEVGSVASGMCASARDEVGSVAAGMCASARDEVGSVASGMCASAIERY